MLTVSLDSSGKAHVAHLIDPTTVSTTLSVSALILQHTSFIHIPNPGFGRFTVALTLLVYSRVCCLRNLLIEIYIYFWVRISPRF